MTKERYCFCYCCTTPPQRLTHKTRNTAMSQRQGRHSWLGPVRQTVSAVTEQPRKGNTNSKARKDGGKGKMENGKWKKENSKRRTTKHNTANRMLARANTYTHTHAWWVKVSVAAVGHTATKTRAAPVRRSLERRPSWLLSRLVVLGAIACTCFSN